MIPIFGTHPELQRSLLSACLLCVSIGSIACSEPPEKPIPPFDPSKAVKEPTTDVKEKPATPARPGTLTRMPLGNLYQLVQSNAALIFDVRPAFIYKLGHIPGAISFPKSNFDRDIEKYETRITTANSNNTPVVLYCTDLACPDAMTVATRLAQRGYDVSILQGGYEAWKIAMD